MSPICAIDPLTKEKFNRRGDMQANVFKDILGTSMAKFGVP
jgi:hypothetical protein